VVEPSLARRKAVSFFDSCGWEGVGQPKTIVCGHGCDGEREERCGKRGDEGEGEAHLAFPFAPGC
jgi:hypothetical protein